MQSQEPPLSSAERRQEPVPFPVDVGPFCSSFVEEWYEHGGIRNREDRAVALLGWVRKLLKAGPVWNTFVRYCGIRIDLFPADHAKVLLTEGGHDSYSRDDDMGGFGRKEGFQLLPAESNSLILVFRSFSDMNLRGFMIHPAFRRCWPSDSERIRVLRESFHLIWPRTDFDRLVNEFLLEIENFVRSDFQLPAAESEREWSFERSTAAGEVEAGLHLFRMPARFRNLGSVLFSKSGEATGKQDAYKGMLQQVADGNPFPGGIDAFQIGLLESGGLVLLRGPAVCFPGDATNLLLDYLFAVASGQPDKACESLLGLLEKRADTLSDNALRDLFRQIVPFRDGGLEGREKEVLSFLFIQLRLAAEGGCRLRVEMQPIFRLLWMHHLSENHNADREDAFLMAHYDFRVKRAIGQIETLLFEGMALSKIGAWLELLLELPDRLVRLSRSGDDQPGSVGREEPARDSQRSSSRLMNLSLIADILIFVALLLNTMAIAGVDISERCLWILNGGSLALFVANRLHRLFSGIRETKK
jgi:hypothetical protein